MPFFSDVITEPKRLNRFEFHLDGIEHFVVESAAKPSFSVSEVKHSYKQHTFRWPGKTEWKPIQVTMVDPVQPDVAKTIVNKFVSSGYLPPTSKENAGKFLSKAKMVDSIGQPRIVQINADNEVLEAWTLHNAFIIDSNFGTLDYNQDGLVKLQFTITYDYATLEDSDLTK